MIHKAIALLASVCVVGGRFHQYHHNLRHHQSDEQISAPSEHHPYIDEDDDQHVDYYAPAQYKYSYGVEDFKTGDYKTHKEEREGDVVRGEYTVADPDGTIRTVTYTVDKHSGFQAVVTKSKNEHFKPIEYIKSKEQYRSSVHVPVYPDPDKDGFEPIHRSASIPSRSYQYPRQSAYDRKYDLKKFYYRDNRQHDSYAP